MYLECQKNFAIACLRKKLGCHTEICDKLKFFILSYSFFFTGSKRCSNQTKPVMKYLHCKQSVVQKNYAIAGL